MPDSESGPPQGDDRKETPPPGSTTQAAPGAPQAPADQTTATASGHVTSDSPKAQPKESESEADEPQGFAQAGTVGELLSPEKLKEAATKQLSWIQEQIFLEMQRIADPLLLGDDLRTQHHQHKLTLWQDMESNTRETIARLERDEDRAIAEDERREKIRERRWTQGQQVLMAIIALISVGIAAGAMYVQKRNVDLALESAQPDAELRLVVRATNSGEPFKFVVQNLSHVPMVNIRLFVGEILYSPRWDCLISASDSASMAQPLGLIPELGAFATQSVSYDLSTMQHKHDGDGGRRLFLQEHHATGLSVYRR